ncbi:MAG: glycosyltransferase [Synergistaceae bacterium]|nr:glycosyltransferase [Synergistaceae bacterium]
MTANQLVSVIVPVYNASAHLRETLASIIAQDYGNLEIIIVDDASTDSSRDIAQEMLSESCRPYRIIDHTQNLGVSCARNAGLDSARGAYVWFCDGDDIAEYNLVSELMGLPESDIAFGGIISRYEDGRPDEILKAGDDLPVPLDGEEALYHRMLKPIAPHTCCMMFKRDFLLAHSIRFHEGCTAFEDIEFQMKAFCHAKRVSFTKECLYIYVNSPEMGSVRDNDTREKSLRRYIDSSEAHFRTAEYLSKNAPSERTKYLADYLLMPEAVIRKFTVCAKDDDREGFDALLKDKRVREVLLSSRRVFFRKPELFMKALAVLYMPGLYFAARRTK